MYNFNFYSSVGWRLGLQQITGLLITTFLLGTFYRSASLYHPQRRAILHLKTQKRKIKNKDKEKNKLQVRLKNYVCHRSSSSLAFHKMNEKIAQFCHSLKNGSN